MRLLLKDVKRNPRVVADENQVLVEINEDVILEFTPEEAVFLADAILRAAAPYYRPFRREVRTP
jgi:hypothetical protein